MKTATSGPSSRLILASGSRHRRSLLERLRVSFEVIAPEIDETALPGERPAETAAAPPLRKLPPLPTHWRVTGTAATDGLKVHEEPSLQAPVVHVFEPQAACIKLAGGCQKPWCQVVIVANCQPPIA